MDYSIMKAILLSILFVSFFQLSFSQDTNTFKGIGLGFEYYNGHQDFKKNFSFKGRQPKQEYKIGRGVYFTYFNLDSNKKINYYIDAGFIFWQNQEIDKNITLKQHSELIRITGSYGIGKISLIGRVGGLLNHNKIDDNNLISRQTNTSLVLGSGISYSLYNNSLPLLNGLHTSFLINRIDKNWIFSSTILIPLIF